MLRIAGRRLLSVQQRSCTATTFVLSRDHTIDSSPAAPRSAPSADLSSFNSYHRSLIRGLPKSNNLPSSLSGLIFNFHFRTRAQQMERLLREPVDLSNL
ncbi:hypothetical protein F2Q69_00044944 [Brassica cretica]|uniref:Uncharacterized protein n=1 Tax=Brassica cretica TaxID=69181 RepID=A0A8S9NKB3_BRACR|nr:hypothetical protein F2Q69_00044944 [Brassica cretica]